MAREEIYEYYTLAGEGYGEYREKGSKFLAYAYPVTTEEEVEEHIAALRKLHPKSRHYCYAYILDRYQQQFRANDDGEPSGTAGRPILGQLHSAEVVEAVVIVVRYFGGTKLGASGLIRAYKDSAAAAVSDAGRRLVQLTDDYRLEVDYAQMGHVLDCIKSLDIEITDKSFETNATIDIALPAPSSSEILIALQARILGVSTEQIDEKTIIPGCSIIKLP
jgi:uncharacterized YigZ family protein